MRSPSSDMAYRASLSKRLIPFFACLAYTTFSMVMTLSNKVLLNNYHFSSPTLLLIWQHVVTVVVVLIYRTFFSTPPSFSLRIAINWLPVNLFFVGMLVTGQYSLKYLSVPMITIFKNFATIGVATGDYFVFKRHLAVQTINCLLLMFGSSVIAGFNDLAFTLRGYIWMTFNVLLTVSYSLWTERVKTKMKLTATDMLFYNNILAIPFLLGLLGFDLEAVYRFEFDQPPMFWVVFVINGLGGLLISASAFWTLDTTSPTTLSIIGSLNKIPLTIIGFIFFNSPVTELGLISISIGLASGVAYAYAKATEPKSLPQKSEKTTSV